MAKMTKCKVCGADMATTAKSCPQCDAKNKKPIFKRWWFWAVCVVVLLVIISSASGKNSDTSNESETAQAAESTYGESISEVVATKSATDVPSEISEQEPKEPEPKAVESYEITDEHFEYYVNSIGSTEYRAWVEITNTGTTNLYMDSCTFDLEDDNGHLLQTDNFISSCPDIIAPGEKGYFYNGMGFGASSIDEGVSLENGVNLVPQVSIKAARSNPVDYEVTDTDLRAGTFGYPTITGRVTNTSDEDESLFYIQAIFYDENGSVLAITGTNITDFTVGKTASFEISGITLGDDVSMDMIADYQIIARAPYYQFG